MTGDHGIELNTAVQWQQVTCRGCKRAYQCTPEDDYYDATTLEDGACFACLLTESGRDPETTQVVVVDQSGEEIDPRDLATPENFERWRSQ